MTLRPFLVAPLLTLAGVLSTIPTIAAPAATAAGSYRNWNRAIDEVVIIQPFRADNYRDVVVEPLDSSQVQMPDKSDRQYKAVVAGLKSIKRSFIEGLEQNLRERNEHASGAKGVTGNALVIRTRLTKVDPGSENARFYIGFGAGAVRVAMVGEIFEGDSHRTLVTFKQERRSGLASTGSTGFADLFPKIAREIGGDVASLINAF